ncbi:MAG: DUF2029 domain-containing protein [Candidatus Heimdallarchaeota archaeon]|nr:DUF2029 domain-containing protein [Candidatus Heimdallarchaeota archaeon]
MLKLQTDAPLQNELQYSKSRFLFLNISQGIRKIWDKPETKIIFLVIIARIFFIIATHYGMDFDFYVEIAQRVLAGEKLYTDIESTHMPLVDLIYVAMYTLCPWKQNIIAVRIFLKFPFLLTDIGIALSVMKIIEFEKRKEPSFEDKLTSEQIKNLTRSKLIAGYFVAFSLPLIFQTGGGRYDSLMIFCFAMVVYYLQRRNWFGVAFFAALGTSAKYIGVIFLPFVILWMKKEDIKSFTAGIFLGLLPIYPFLITRPTAFIEGIFLRGSHIAYGFSIWHAIFIIWNNFSMKYVDGIESTYDSSGEPWFVSNLYLPLFIAVYGLIFTLYVIKWWNTIRTENIEDQTLTSLVNFVFIPLFIFGLTFKAINLQVLAWFTPYIALKNKLDLLIEYTFLTLIFGIGLLFFESYNVAAFEALSLQSAGKGSVFYILLIRPISIIRDQTSSTIWVGIIFATIIWYLIRTSIELGISTKEILSIKNKNLNNPIEIRNS